ncbi:hypothetical protein [Cupriavidus sp. RAF20_2]|uniref:hypothetical protein n=1 Tax=Cupriavidus sp. RAF20_2 TaxID=3233053 RepID=UPI003F931741
MTQYQTLLDQVQRAKIREQDQRAELANAADTLPSRLSEYLGAPPERISIELRDSSDSRVSTFDLSIAFGSNGTIDHITVVPVKLEVTRHGIGARVADSNQPRVVGKLPQLEWRLIFPDILEVLQKDCQARESKSAF